MSTPRQTQRTPWDNGGEDGYQVIVPRFGYLIPSTQASFAAPCIKREGVDGARNAWIDEVIARRTAVVQ